MDTDNERALKVENSQWTQGDWRSQLQPGLRQRIINKLIRLLWKHLPFTGEEGMRELERIATRFEEKICPTASSQSDYLRKISLQLLTLETSTTKSSLKQYGVLP